MPTSRLQDLPFSGAPPPPVTCLTSPPAASPPCEQRTRREPSTRAAPQPSARGRHPSGRLAPWCPVRRLRLCAQSAAAADCARRSQGRPSARVGADDWPPSRITVSPRAEHSLALSGGVPAPAPAAGCPALQGRTKGRAPHRGPSRPCGAHQGRTKGPAGDVLHGPVQWPVHFTRWPRPREGPSLRSVEPRNGGGAVPRSTDGRVAMAASRVLKGHQGSGGGHPTGGGLPRAPAHPGPLPVSSIIRLALPSSVLHLGNPLVC